jgi:hypothetical protein
MLICPDLPDYDALGNRRPYANPNPGYGPGPIRANHNPYDYGMRHGSYSH